MLKTPKFLLTLIGLIIVAVIFNRFYQYYVMKNFLLRVNAPCDPAVSDCFVADCSFADDPECDTTPYAKVEILAAQAPTCLEEHICQSFSCSGLSQCQITPCSSETIEEGERCATQQP